MKIFLHKILAIFMSLIVMVSVLSFTVDLHYCGDTLIDTAIFSEVKNCGMQKTSRPDTTDCTITKKSCCTDAQLIFEGQDELKTPFDQLTIEHKYFIESVYYVYNPSFTDSENAKIISLEEYPPPVLIQELFMLNESFLI